MNQAQFLDAVLGQVPDSFFSGGGGHRFLVRYASAKSPRIA